ncbi:MAG TPA: hypothetical protein VGH28_16130 [Polyangiaceae bacterium]|jgi:hypothetical protein
MRKRPLALAAAAICVLCTNVALAQDKSYTETSTGSGQDVTFTDADTLSASQFDGGGGIIRVTPSPKRVLLLRPRTQFVTELLKSVEAL